MASKIIPISKYVIALTGEGVLKESKQKNFRTASFGLWSLEDFLRFAYPDTIKRSKTRIEGIYNTCLKELEDYRDNAIHKILARWESSNIIKGIITENVEGLHQKAGSKRVLEIYGSMRELYCTACGMTYPVYKYYSEDPAICSCGGFVRPSVVLSYESIPGKTKDSIKQEIMKADLILAVGSSPTDKDIVSLVKEAVEKGAKLAIINGSPTNMDDYAYIVVRSESIGEELEKIDKELRY
jgi:NAD-dependent deacetylase